MKQFFLLFFVLTVIHSQSQTQPWQGKFEPIDNLLTTPNSYRTGSGAPGKEYWQQRADYKIDVILDEDGKTLSGEEWITYYNNSPDDLNYLWIQLDQNINNKGNEDLSNWNNRIKDSMTARNLQILTRALDFPSGYSLKFIKDKNGKDLKSIINNTMMKVQLHEPLKSGETFNFSISWSYPITDRSLFRLSREGYEYFPKDGNSVFLMGHWFPRMCVYNDTEGWQNQQFQRLGEFALEFGDYEVRITVPADHIVAATGILQNADNILTKTQRDRLEKAQKSFDKPILIITKDEAKENEKKASKDLKTWKFVANNVRDFAFACSRKFIWDAQAVELPTNTVMAMSFYPKEGLPVWQEESTKAIKNALEVYSEATFDYPYPVAISVNTSNVGIEYPMISYNGGRPKKGLMSQSATQRMVSTIIHEVGHNWFPMIVSSDERKWMWMDEGLNTFLHQRTIEERYPDAPHTTPKTMVPFMSGDKTILRPIMTTSDNELLTQFGNNFYQKPTVGFQMLRNTIVGKELFDAAFKEYANRWKYKHPNPSDLFRTLEDATATDLDWFFKGWFYTTDHVDLEISDVKWFKIRDNQKDIEKPQQKLDDKKSFISGPEVIDITDTPESAYGGFLSRLDTENVIQELQGKNLYEITLKNLGGLVMPVIIEWLFTDGTSEIDRLPAEIWRKNEYEVRRTFVKNKVVEKVNLDPNFELPDTDTSNNIFPKETNTSEFDKFKKEQSSN